MLNSHKALWDRKTVFRAVDLILSEKYCPMARKWTEHAERFRHVLSHSTESYGTCRTFSPPSEKYCLMARKGTDNTDPFAHVKRHFLFPIKTCPTLSMLIRILNIPVSKTCLDIVAICSYRSERRIIRNPDHFAPMDQTSPVKKVGHFKTLLLVLFAKNID